MSRIVMAGMPAAGHVNPSLPLVRELVRQQVEVTCYSTEEFRDRLERAGARFRPYPEGTISAQIIADATRAGGPVRVVARGLHATEALQPFLVHELQEDRPDAVAFDSNAIWGRMAAAELGLPMISFMTTMLVGAGGMRQLTAREWGHFLAESAPGIPAAVAARRRLTRAFDARLLPPRPMFPMRGDVTVFPIPRWLQPADSRIDAGCRFIGATVDPGVRDQELDADLAAHLDGPEPVVLVSMGTLHAGSDAFFRTCLEVLADLPARVVLAVGASADRARLGRPPANTLVRTSVPQLEVLRRATVFVTHGGMNSALEGLANGVPLVVIPQQFEQLLIGHAVAEQGAGVVLRHNLSNRPVPPARLRTAVELALTDNGLRTAAEALAARVGEGGGAAAGAEAIRELLAARTTPTS